MRRSILRMLQNIIYTLGDINTDDYQFMADTIMPVMTIGDYNSVARLYGNSTYELNDDEYIIVADYKNMVMIRNQALKKGIILSVNGKEYKPRYSAWMVLYRLAFRI